MTNVDRLKQFINENKSYQEISEYFNVSKKTIYNWCKKHRIEKPVKSCFRKYRELDVSYFNNIDNEEKAYYLGLIMSDGSLNEKVVEISLKNEDSYILERLANNLNMGGYVLGNKKNNTQKRLSICSKHMVKSLEKYTVIPNKTFIVDMPNIDKDLLRHFLRGYFDGDGYIGERTCSLIISSETFLKSFESYYYSLFSDKIHVRKIKNSYCIDFYKRNRKFINFIYKNNNISLIRKYEKFKQYWLE